MQISARIMDIAYGFAKDMAVAGKIPANAKAIAKFARDMGKELNIDFMEPNASA